MQRQVEWASNVSRKPIQRIFTDVKSALHSVTLFKQFLGRLPVLVMKYVFQ